MLIESQAGKLISKCMVTIEDETVVLQQHGEECRRVPFKLLKTGQKVKIWFPGPNLVSSLGQGAVQQMAIIK